MKTISVVIPTANRPHYLEVALASVSAQTVAGDIEEVIVSENLGCRESEAVCARFAHLPIRYVFREPQLGNTEHIQALFLEARAPLVALLCDDDWWSPAHLHLGVHALEENPMASAWFSAVLLTASEEEREDVRILRPLPFTLAARAIATPETSALVKRWSLPLEHVFTISWLLTPFHFSTMVARRAALREASELLTDAHPFYTDRILYPGLVLHGPLLYEPLPDTFARCHPGNWQKDKNMTELVAAHREGSEKIRRLGKEHGVDVVARWKAITATFPKNSEDEFADSFRGILSDAQLRELGFDQFVGPSYSLLQRILRKGIRIVKKVKQAPTSLRHV